MDPILLGKGLTDDVAVTLLPRFGNRHGLIAGATGTGKTVTLMTLAENFSRIGVPVFLADAKGDVAGLAMPGVVNEKLASPPPATPPFSGTCTAVPAIRCAPP